MLAGVAGSMLWMWTIFHLNCVCCQLRHRYHNYKHCKTTKTQVFASVQNSHRTSQLTVQKHSFLSKCWFTISHEHSNSFHLNFITIQVVNAQVGNGGWVLEKPGGCNRNHTPKALEAPNWPAQLATKPRAPCTKPPSGTRHTRARCSSAERKII